MTNERTIVIGDVHGCLDELRELLLEVVEVRETDRVIMLGDLIDKGPDPAGVVAFVKGLGAVSVMGNHEEKALRWRRHEQRRKEDPTRYKNPMRHISSAKLEQWAKIPDSHWDWIATWPTFVHINDKWTAVHAGCLPDVSVEDQFPNELMRLRYVKTTTDEKTGKVTRKMAGLSDTGEVEAKPGQTINHWTELWTGPRNIVYGHYVWDKIHITDGSGARTFGLDTGCVHGGKLSALVFCKDHTYAAQVEAAKVYAENRFASED